MAESMLKQFRSLQDPRGPAGRRHSLTAMLTIAICAVICGAQGWTDVEEFGLSRLAWFKTFLDLPHGIASHDTFGRVFAALQPAAFERCFMRWVKGLVKASRGRLIAVDGKTLRRSFDQAAGKSAIHMVSAFASANRLVFGQIKTAAKSNEITAIPKLLKLLNIEGSVVTIDAMGCQRAIAQEILKQRADYVLGLKENQGVLHAKVKTLLDEAIAQNFQGLSGDCHKETCKGHGRIEVRTCWSTGEVHWLKDIDPWPGLKSVLAVESRRTMGGQVAVERRYFLSSLDGEDAQKLAEAVRGHWGVENPLHWVLDVAFSEDHSRVRMGYAAENLSRLRRIALNMLQRESSGKRSIRLKRLKAGWDHDYLLQILQT
jgi:predicted transposase YbfD/YdcC